MPFPPATREAGYAQDEWRNGAAQAVAEQKPARAPGPVDICVTLEDRRDFRAFDNLTANILHFLVCQQIIAAAHSTIVRRMTVQFGGVLHGARVEISRAAA